MKRNLIFWGLITVLTTGVFAQNDAKEELRRQIIVAMTDSATVTGEDKSIPMEAEKVDTTPTFVPTALPSSFLMPPVFDGYKFYDLNYNPLEEKYSDLPESANWLKRQLNQAELLNRVKQNYLIYNAEDVDYVASTMKKAPQKFFGKADPKKSKVTIQIEDVDKSKLATDIEVDIKKRNWLHDFQGSLQFSQAYISPNWYQGGNNNLNAIAFISHNVKLNRNFHPNLLFESSFQYKLAINNAPTDSVHDINISEDLLQINSKFGVKAYNKWFYSITADFKTQVLKNFKPNTHDLTAAIFSPGELNVGLGMTYNHANKKKSFTIDASIAPLSYNMKMCTYRDLNPADFGIDNGHKVAHQFGSSGEVKIKWQFAKNASYNSRLFIFTDYNYVQGDFENNFEFTFSRYLSTRIFAHLRYDTSTASLEGSKWHRWQLKEILSFGLSYKFSTKN